MGKVMCTLSHKQPMSGAEGIILTYDAGEIYEAENISDMAYFEPIQKKRSTGGLGINDN